MSLSPLLQLPTEILLDILKFAVSSPDPPPHVTLINLSQTCSHLHHAIFCSENDSIWHGPALALGIPESLYLEQVLYPGSSTVQRRLWLNVVKLNLGWSRPFPAGTPTIPRSQKVPREMPPPDTRGNWFGRRTIELFTYGEGNRKGAAYWSKHTSVKDDGCAIFQVQGATTVTASGTRFVTGVLDPALGKVREVSSEWKSQSTWTPTPFPVSAGFLVEERNNEYRVRAVDAQTMSLSQLWNLGKRIPNRFVANGEILVAVTFPDPDNEDSDMTSNIPSNLLCVESVRQGKFEGEKPVGVESKVLWEFDLSREWAEDEAYTSFPYLKNFHITRSHLVCLVTRHPSLLALGKLTRTNFLVVSLGTGKVLKTMEFGTKSASVLSGNGVRAAFTTAFAHDFLLTDTHIVSGGAGGGLLVWDYSKNDREPVYIIPDPLDSDAAKIDDAPLFSRQYSALSLSADGRFVGATTSDKLWLFDMVEKKVHGVYSNGRKIKKNDYYTKNPFDEFPAGVWCWWREWRSGRNVRTGEVGWEEVEGCGGVVYLTDLGDERSLLDTSRICREVKNYGGIAHLAHSDDSPLVEVGEIIEPMGVGVGRSEGVYWVDKVGKERIWARQKFLIFLVLPAMIAFMIAMLIRYQRV